MVRERDALRAKLGGRGFQEFTLGGCFMEEMNLVSSLIKSIFIQQFFWQAERGWGLGLALGRHRLLEGGLFRFRNHNVWSVTFQ